MKTKLQEANPLGDPRKVFKAARQAEIDAEAARAKAEAERRAERELVWRAARRLKALEAGPELRDGEEQNEKAMWFRENLEWEEYPELWVVPFSAYSDYSGSFVERANAKWLTDNLECISQSGGGHGTVWTGVADDARWTITDEEFEQLKEIVDGLENYPVIDDEIISDLEAEAQNDDWQQDGRKEFVQALVKHFEDRPDIQQIIRTLPNDTIDDIAWNSELSSQYETEEGGTVYLRLDNHYMERFTPDVFEQYGDPKRDTRILYKGWSKRLKDKFWLPILDKATRDDPGLAQALTELRPREHFRLFTKLMHKAKVNWEWDDDETDAVDAFDIDIDEMEEMAAALERGDLRGLKPEDPRQLKLALDSILAGAPTWTLEPLFEGFKEKKRQFVEQGADLEEVVEYITRFKTAKQRGLLQGEAADIDRYSDFDSLKAAVESAEQKKTKTQRKKEIRHKEAIIVRDDDKMQIAVPMTWDAAKHYGKGTKWCISMKDYDTHWTSYRKDLAKHYMIWNKQTEQPGIDSDGNPVAGDKYYKIAVTVWPGRRTDIRDALDAAMSEDELHAATGYVLRDFESWDEKELEGKELFRLMGKKNVSFRDRVERMGEEGWALMGKNAAMRDLWQTDQQEDLKGKNANEVEQAWNEFWQKARRELLDYPDDEDYERSLQFYVESQAKLPPGKRLALLEELRHA